MGRIYIAAIVLFIVLGLWTWNNLKEYDNIAIKIAYLVVGILGIIFITTIIFNISAKSIQYPNSEMIGEVRKVILLIFVPINGLLILPQYAKLFVNYQNDELEIDKITKRAIIIGIIFIIAIIIEISYFKNIQQGIIQIINNNK